MTRRLSAPLILSSLLVACASEPTNEPAEPRPAEQASSPAGSEEGPRAVRLADLEGVWQRDDQLRYHLVEHEGRLIGYGTDEAYFGCRVVLGEEGGRVLRGEATFVDQEEAADSLLVTQWDLRIQDAGTLAGTVTAWELDPGSDRYILPASEERTFVRVSGFAPNEAEDVRAVAAVHLAFDQALRAEDPDRGMTELAASAQVRGLEHNPHRDSVGARLQAWFAARMHASTSVEASAPSSEQADPEAAPPPTGFEGAWGSAPIGALSELELVAGQGWEGEFNQALGSWTFEKYTPNAEGYNDASRFYLDAYPGDAPTAVGDYAQRLQADPDFQDYGERYAEVTTQEAFGEGFLIEGTVVSTSDADESGPGFVLALNVGAFRLLARGSTFASPALRAEAVALCKALAPLLEASSQPVAHSAGHTAEMAAFLQRLDGSSEGVEAALTAFGIVGLDDAEMGYYTLTQPRLVDSGPDRFTFEAQAGMTTRTYTVHWKAGKIVRVEDGGMR